MTLLAVPNVSEGQDGRVIAAMAAAFGAPGVRLLDIHSDADHNRTVYTLSGPAAQLSESLVRGAAAALEHIDIGATAGAHPRVGALDVAPFVYTEPAEAGDAAAAALLTADRIAAELEIPIFLYGALSSRNLTRADVRRGGPAGLAGRLAAGATVPDYGPSRLHPRAGATLVSARPPLIALNFELAAPADVVEARRIAARVREGGPDGLAGVRAIGVQLRDAVAQVSTNIEDAELTAPARVLAAITRHRAVAAVELVGLPPERFFADFPDDVPRKHFRMLEEALRC